MKLTTICLFVLLHSGSLWAQEILDIPYSEAPENIKWTKSEENQSSEIWFTGAVEPTKINLLVNVSVPQLIYYKPNVEKSNGHAVIVCPGGGFHMLNIEVEGSPVAEWLAKNGIAAFVLKYRLIPTNGNAPKEYAEKKEKGTHREKDGISLALTDGISAIKYLRDNSSSLGIDKDKIGIIGFSAGGTVAMGTVFQASDSLRPNFAAPIYAYLDPFFDMDVPEDAPPLFVCVASDDDLKRVEDNIDIYSRWLRKGISSELHIYSTGGHAFGFKKDGSRIDSWIDRFGDWLTTIGWM
ncbi:MAG: alpha/beta hydrolase [Flavobacteriaceae bacterium]